MDTSNWGTPIELSSGAESGPLRYAELRSAPPGRALYGRRVAAGLCVAGFVLVAASQVLPWLTVGGSVDATTDLGPISDREFSTADGASVLLFAYDILWLPVLVLCASCVFATGSRQRSLFAGGVGALAAQVTVLLPMLSKPGRVIGQGSLFDSGGLHAELSSGAYFAVAAVLLLAGALVLAVNGKVLPTEPDPAPAVAPYPVPRYEVEPAPIGMHAALAASQAGRDPEPDIDYGPQPADVGTYEEPPRVEAVSDHSLYDTRPRPAPVDHSMYARPRESGETRA